MRGPNLSTHNFKSTVSLNLRKKNLSLKELPAHPGWTRHRSAKDLWWRQVSWHAVITRTLNWILCLMESLWKAIKKKTSVSHETFRTKVNSFPAAFWTTCKQSREWQAGLEPGTSLFMLITFRLLGHNSVEVVRQNHIGVNWGPPLTAFYIVPLCRIFYFKFLNQPIK